MTNSGLSIRMLLTGVLLLALLTIATPAAADPGAGAPLEALFPAEGLLGDYSTQCSWWELWC